MRWNGPPGTFLIFNGARWRVISVATPEYDVAVDLLRDLHELAWREGEPDTIDKRLRDLRQRYANRPALLQRLNHAGLPAAAGRS